MCYLMCLFLNHLSVSQQKSYSFSDHLSQQSVILLCVCFICFCLIKVRNLLFADHLTYKCVIFLFVSHWSVSPINYKNVHMFAGTLHQTCFFVCVFICLVVIAQVPTSCLCTCIIWFDASGFFGQSMGPQVFHSL